MAIMHTDTYGTHAFGGPRATVWTSYKIQDGKVYHVRSGDCSPWRREVVPSIRERTRHNMSALHALEDLESLRSRRVRSGYLADLAEIETMIEMVKSIELPEDLAKYADEACE